MTWANLTEDQYLRLCECRSRRADILPIARAFMLERGYNAEDAMVATLEHLECNSQDFDLSEGEWDMCIRVLNKGVMT